MFCAQVREQVNDADKEEIWETRCGVAPNRAQKVAISGRVYVGTVMKWLRRIPMMRFFAMGASCR